MTSLLGNALRRALGVPTWRGCTEGARGRKTRRFLATSETRKRRRYAKNSINRPPPHFNGKQEALDSSPREGFAKGPTKTRFVVAHTDNEAVHQVVHGASLGIDASGDPLPVGR